MKSFLKITAKILGGLVALVILLIIGLFFVPTYTNTVQIDFTRHLSQHAVTDGAAPALGENFVSMPGSGRLIITRTNEDTRAAIQLNGEDVALPDDFNNALQFELPVELTENNTISVRPSGAPGGSLTVRIKQQAELEMHVQSRIHFNANVSDFERSRAFFGNLGFETVSGFPDTNTLAMAEAIGIETPTDYDGSQGPMAGGYLLHGEIIGIGGFSGGVIDLIEFTIPRNEDPPYARLNHLGMAKAAMMTTDITADYAYMVDAGVEFLSPPTTRSDGTVFAIFKDPDGIFYELIEVDGENKETDTTHIFRVGQVNKNVSDFERSAAWYQMMGYEISRPLPSTDTIDVANAMGFDAPFEIDGAIMTHVNDNSTIELVQWLSPFDPERAYEIPVNHFGIHRTAFLSADIEADVATLRAQGVEFLSPITPCCSGDDASTSIIAFYDPDGTIVELASAGPFSKVLTVIGWFTN